jgi:hypothetical protein
MKRQGIILNNLLLVVSMGESCNEFVVNKSVSDRMTAAS